MTEPFVLVAYGATYGLIVAYSVFLVLAHRRARKR